MAEYSQLLDDYPHWKNFLSTKATKPTTSIKGWHTGTIQRVLHQKMSLETCPTTVPQNFEKNWENNPTQPISTTHRMDPPCSLFLHAGAFSLFGRNHLFLWQTLLERLCLFTLTKLVSLLAFTYRISANKWPSSNEPPPLSKSPSPGSQCQTSVPLQ